MASLKVLFERGWSRPWPEKPLETLMVRHAVMLPQVRTLSARATHERKASPAGTCGQEARAPDSVPPRSVDRLLHETSYFGHCGGAVPSTLGGMTP